MRNHDSQHSHGATIGGALIIGLIAFAFSHFAHAAAPTLSRSTAAPQSVTSVEFIILQNQSVQTVTCKNPVLLGDFTGYGHAAGTQCATTGPLLTAYGNLGSFVVDLVGVHLEGCRLETVSIAGSLAQYDINCTH